MAKSSSRIIGVARVLSPRAIKLLEDFTLERVSMGDFRTAFEEMVAELEARPKITPEAKAMVRLWLYLHEADEGFRDIEDAYAYARNLLQAERSAGAAVERSPNENP